MSVVIVIDQVLQCVLGAVAQNVYTVYHTNSIYWLNPVMPLKFVIFPALPPETLRLAQFQDPVQEPTPQLTATLWAPLLTEIEV